jgi:hypothetical protein
MKTNEKLREREAATAYDLFVLHVVFEVVLVEHRDIVHQHSLVLERQFDLGAVLFLQCEAYGRSATMR